MITQLQPSPERVFYQVGGEHPQRMDVISEIFHRILTPLYGSQEKALGQIKESKDRKCFLLYEEETPVGVLVFKTVLSNEFSEYGLRDSIEIKSLFVDQSQQNSGRGLGSALVNKLKEEVEKLQLAHRGIHVTVSETKQESLIFFQKKGFRITHEWEGRYTENVREYLLSCPAKIATPTAVPDRPEPGCFHIIRDAHLDDIHALKKLADGTFISGSKDNCLYKWSKEGQLISIVDEIEPREQSERNWITAVEVINDAYWVSGERNGRLSLWTTEGSYVRDLHPKLPKRGAHVSHEHNVRRINCLATGKDPNRPSLFVGFPTMFDEYNLIEGRTTTTTQVHQNDWVYCIHPLDEKRLLTVTGCTMDLWNKTDKGWGDKETIVPEGRTTRPPAHSKLKRQRPFISSLTSLRSGENLFGFTVFDGSVKVVDLTKKTIVNDWKEHQGRVWALENLAAHTFATSGEDRTIKFWDVRQPKSVRTIADHVGQVTAMLNLDENVLLAGTCPEVPIHSDKGAEIRFYDTRQ